MPSEIVGDSVCIRIMCFHFSFLSYSLLTLVWPKSTGTTGQGNTYRTEKTKTSLAQLDMPVSTHILALSRGEFKEIAALKSTAVR